MRRKKETVKECDCGGAPMGFTTLGDVGGVGAMTTPAQVAMTGAEQMSASCMGSGDNWNGFSDSKSKKKKYYVARKRKKRITKVKENLDYAEAQKLVESMNKNDNTDEYKIFRML